MRFSSDELVFITSISKCSAPFGVFFDKISEANAKERASAAKQELIKKEFLTEDNITSKGLVFIKMWEEYCNADKYMVINNNIIGILSDRRCVIIFRDKDGFEIASGDSAEILYASLKEYDCLRRADEATAEADSISTNIDYDAFRSHANSLGEKNLRIGIFPSNRRPGEERFFYWDDKKIYSYNPHTHEEIVIQPSGVRKFIMEGLDIGKEDLADVV